MRQPVSDSIAALVGCGLVGLRHAGIRRRFSVDTVGLPRGPMLPLARRPGLPGQAAECLLGWRPRSGHDAHPDRTMGAGVPAPTGVLSAAACARLRLSGHPARATLSAATCAPAAAYARAPVPVEPEPEAMPPEAPIENLPPPPNLPPGEPDDTFKSFCFANPQAPVCRNRVRGQR